VSTAVVAAPRTLADVIPMPDDRVARIAREVALVGGFTVLTAVLAQLRFTLGFTPVPITGQTFAVLLAGTVLGWQRGLASQALYWAAGIVVPFAWYADGTHGWQVAHGTTAGYLAGFVVAAAVVGYLAERGQDRSIVTSIPAMLAGTAVVYACGVLWLAYKLNVPVADGETNAIELGITPFLIGDALKLTAAGLVTPLAWQAVDRWRS
jgi:biotin transport system substrate-specific component